MRVLAVNADAMLGAVDLAWCVLCYAVGCLATVRIVLTRVGL